MGLSCNMCGGSTLMVTFALLLKHYHRVHSQDWNFNVVCSIGGCGQTYRNFYGYRSHVRRKHRGIWENAGNVTQFVNNQDQGHQVQAQLEVQNQGQPDHDVPEFENIPDDNDSICSDPDDYQYSFRCASYILRMKETYNLTQKAVNDLIVNTETFVREGIQAVSQKIKDEVTNLSQVVFDQVKWDDIDSDSSGIANPFQGMKTTTTQRCKFKDMFGFIVSMD